MEKHTSTHQPCYCIISIGSNSDAERRVALATEKLQRLLHDCFFSKAMWTEPIGLPTEADHWPDKPFLNMLVAGRTNYNADELERKLKSMEKRLGRNEADKRRGTVAMDLDILRMGTLTLHPDDWQRPYVKELMEDLRQICKAAYEKWAVSRQPI